MNADASPGNSSGKRAILPGFAVSIFHLLRLYWVTELALLVVAVIGLRAGWSAPQQWSDGLFLGASAQMMVAAVSLLSTRGEALDASWVRYVDHGNVMETRRQLVMDTLRRNKFGLRVFIGGLLTFLLAALALWV